MVFQKIKKMLDKNDEKYEILHHRYSKLKSEKNQIEKNKQIQLEKHKDELTKKSIKEILNIYKEFEDLKSYSINLKTASNEVRNLVIKINKIDNDLKKTLKNFELKEFIPKRKDLFDKTLHEIQKYECEKDYADAEIIKCTKIGWTHNNQVIIKAKVVVNKNN